MRRSLPAEEENEHEDVTLAVYEAHPSSAPTPAAAYSNRRRDILRAVSERGGRPSMTPNRPIRAL